MYPLQLQNIQTAQMKHTQIKLFFMKYHGIVIHKHCSKSKNLSSCGLMAMV